MKGGDGCGCCGVGTRPHMTTSPTPPSTPPRPSLGGGRRGAGTSPLSRPLPLPVPAGRPSRCGDARPGRAGRVVTVDQGPGRRGRGRCRPAPPGPPQGEGEMGSVGCGVSAVAGNPHQLGASATPPPEPLPPPPACAPTRVTHPPTPQPHEGPPERRPGGRRPGRGRGLGPTGRPPQPRPARAHVCLGRRRGCPRPVVCPRPAPGRLHPGAGPPAAPAHAHRPCAQLGVRRAAVVLPRAGGRQRGRAGVGGWEGRWPSLAPQ